MQFGSHVRSFRKERECDEQVFLRFQIAQGGVFAFDFDDTIIFRFHESLLYSVTKKVYNGEIIPPESADFTKNDNLFAFQAKVLKELAERESFICIGRAADYVLRDYPRVVSIFVYAPLENCIQTEMNRLGLTRKEAEKRIAEQDKHRRAYYKYHTGKEWESPYNYDLCLNTGELTYDQCVDIIRNYLKVKYDIDL